MPITLLIDLLLCVGCVLIAAMTVMTKRIFTSIILYISLGLFVTIIWTRLNAWDVAIAEAAIGAGLTGALLLTAWKIMSDGSSDQKESRNVP